MDLYHSLQLWLQNPSLQERTVRANTNRCFSNTQRVDVDSSPPGWRTPRPGSTNWGQHTNSRTSANLWQGRHPPYIYIYNIYLYISARSPEVVRLLANWVYQGKPPSDRLWPIAEGELFDLGSGCWRGAWIWHSHPAIRKRQYFYCTVFNFSTVFNLWCGDWIQCDWKRRKNNTVFRRSPRNRLTCRNRWSKAQNALNLRHDGKHFVCVDLSWRYTKNDNSIAEQEATQTPTWARSNHRLVLPICGLLQKKSFWDKGKKTRGRHGKGRCNEDKVKQHTKAAANPCCNSRYTTMACSTCRQMTRCQSSPNPKNYRYFFSNCSWKVPSLQSMPKRFKIWPT